MNPTLLEIIQTHGNGTESTCYCELTSSSVPTGKAELKEGFFFLLVTNGTAQLADEYQTYELQPAHLVTLTPSTKCMIQATSSHFQSMLLYLKPTFFDSLPDGQPLYERWCVKMHTLFFMTTPRLSQAEALLLPKDFVSLSISKVIWQRYIFVLTIPIKSSFSHKE